jgi:hypothetical protein
MSELVAFVAEVFNLHFVPLAVHVPLCRVAPRAEVENLRHERALRMMNQERR